MTYPTHFQPPQCTHGAFPWRWFSRSWSSANLKLGWWCKEYKRTFNNLSMTHNLAFGALRTHQSLIEWRVGGDLLPSNWSFVVDNDPRVTFATFSFVSIVVIHGKGFSNPLMSSRILSSTLELNSSRGKIRSFRWPFWMLPITFITLCYNQICKIMNFFGSLAQFDRISTLMYCIGSDNFILSLWLSYHSPPSFFKIPLSWCWSNLQFNGFF